MFFKKKHFSIVIKRFKLNFFVILNPEIKMNTPLVPFEAGSPIIISDPTGSGKTYRTHKLLANEMFTQHTSSILYCYGVYQSYFHEMKVHNLEFHEGLPSREKVESLNDGKFHIIVLDDLMEQIVKECRNPKLIYKILSSL